MTRKHRWLGIAGLVALLAALGVACGEEETKEVNLCEGVVCDVNYPGSTCDPLDGLCKCGTGDDRILCKSGEACEADPTPTCIETACVGVHCDNGQVCDPTDGVCKCGTSTCTGDEECVQNRCVIRNPCANKSCAEGQTCDPEDGQCKCGGEICGEDERCDDGICVADPCKGVYCGPNSVCNPDDRACHCGSVTGPACATGEACVLEDGDYVCTMRDLCEGVVCTGHSVCDPDVGICRCGGVGPEFPECRPDQLCQDGACVGGDLCFDAETRCAPGFTCDPVDGQCKCGGAVCTETETCMALADENFACVAQCDPLVTVSCESGESCYLDLDLQTTVGYCTSEGSGGETDTCEAPHDCRAGHTCLSGICRPICDVTLGQQDNPDCGNRPMVDCVQRVGNIGVCFDLAPNP